MKRETYQRGLPGVKWGIWNCQRKCFQFDICEDTPMLPKPGSSRRLETTPGSGVLSPGSCPAIF